MNYFGHRHSIQGKGSIWTRRADRPAVGVGVEEAKRFIRLALEKAGLCPVKVLLELFTEKRESHLGCQDIYTPGTMSFIRAHCSGERGLNKR